MTHDRTTAGLPPLLADTLSEALGQTRRDDPVLDGSGGPAGNARLTAWLGLILLALSVAELVTLINVRGLISWHVVIGTLLVPPALLKTGSTGWLILRYYRGQPDYRRAGPPPMLLRLLGPGVIVSTLGLLGSGLLLILLGRQTSRDVLLSAFGQQLDWLTLHKALFLVWGVLTGLHALARFIPALQLTMGRRPDGPAVDGARARTVGLAVVSLVAVLAAVLVLAGSGSWKHDRGGEREGRLPGSATTAQPH